MRFSASTCPRLFLACALLGLALLGPARAADAPRPDAYGDPLPDGALARLGTLRWRAGNPLVMTAFLPDGKSILSVSQDYVVQVWDRDTGKELRKFDAAGPAPTAVNGPRVVLLNPYNSNLVLSADGKSLACVGRDGAVRIWDVATAKEVHKLGDSGGYGGQMRLALTADGKTLAVSRYAQKTTLWDVAAGKELRSFGADATPGNRMMAYKTALSPDGKRLVEVGIEVTRGINTTAVVWDTATGKETARFTDPAAAVGSITAMNSAISPDAKLLALPDGAKVKLIDLTTAKEARQLDGADGASSLVFTADGKQLIGMTGRNEALIVWETATGRTVRQVGKAEAPPAGAVVAVNRLGYNLSVSGDGKLLAWGDGPAVRLVDLESGKEKNAAAGHASGLRGVALAPNGKTALTWGDDATVRRWESATGKELGRLPLPSGSHTAVIPSPDQRLVAACDADGTVHLIDATTGKETHALKPDQPSYGRSVAFSPDSRLLAAVSLVSQAVQVFDVSTGKEKRSLLFPPPQPVAGPGGIRPVFIGGRGLRRAFFSPDGRLVAATDGTLIAVWDVASGREERQIVPPQPPATGYVIAMLRDAAFSPDGRTIAVETGSGEIGVWELASGSQPLTLNAQAKVADPIQQQKLALSIASGVANGSGLAFSPDGRLLAQAQEQKARLWDVRAAKEVAAFDGHRGAVTGLTFSADGKRLATASADTTALLWDAEPVAKKLAAPAAALPKEKLVVLWTDLGEADGARAYEAVRALAGDPAQAVPFLAEHLQGAAPPDAAQLAKLIAGLDNDEFLVREASRKELEKLGELALPALREALKGNPSAEQRRSLEELLEGAGAPSPSGERLRLQRAVEALEMTATPEAVRVLKSLAAGAPGALPTTQAQASLDRLGHR
jgi:WD40 repeat protein